MFNGYHDTPGAAGPLWQAYKPSPRFDKVAEILDRRDYKTWGERKELTTEGTKLAMEDSGSRLSSVDAVYVWPRRKGSGLASVDLAGGISGSSLLRLYDPAC